MKSDTFTKISTVKDVERLVKYIYNDLGVNFHPDDDFNDIIHQETGKKTFSKKDADKYNKLVSDCFDICEKNNVDFYEIALKFHPVLLED